MSEIKWIKLTTNVFDDEKFDAIKTLPDGNDIQLAWVKLLCLAGRCNENGFLVLTNEIPYTDEMLAKRFSMDIGIVQRAMTIFQNLDMVEVVDNAYMVSNWLKYQSGDRLEDLRRKGRERQAKYREKQKQLKLEVKENDDFKNGDVTCDVTVTGFCSYSYISNSNISNLKHIIDNSIYKDTDYLNNNTRLLDGIRDWMEYKDNKKPKSNHHYDTEMGISKLLTTIIKHDRESGTDYVVECIDNSIANNYQGIAWKDSNTRKSKGFASKEEMSTWA